MNQPIAPRAVRLFDELMTQEQPTQERAPLGRLDKNRNIRTATSGPKKPNGNLRQRLEERIEEQSRPKVHFHSSPGLWEREQQKKEAKMVRGTRTKAPRKNKNFPDCTKDALLEAFEKAGLPDYDKIMEHELHVTVVQPWEVRKPYMEKPSTPPMKDLLAVFDDTNETSKAPSPSKKRRTRSSLQQSTLEEASFVDDVPQMDESEQLIDSSPNTSRVRFKLPAMASTPLVSGNGNRPLPSFSTASSIRRGSSRKDDSTLKDIENKQTFLQPKKAPAKKSVKSSMSKTILLLPRKQVDTQETEVATQETEPITQEDDVPEVSPPPANKTRTRSRMVMASTPSASDGSPSVNSEADQTVVPRKESVEEADSEGEAPVTKSSSKKLTTTTIEVVYEDDSFRRRHSIFQTPSAYHVVAGRRLHPTLKNLSLYNTSLIGNQTASSNRSIFSKSTVKKRQSRFKSIVPDLTNSRRVSKSPPKEVAINGLDELRDLLQHSCVTAFNETRVIHDVGEEEIFGPKKKVLVLCGQIDVTPFDEALKQLDSNFLNRITKIGEGSYGEVYKSIDSTGKDVILKVVPFDPDKSEEEVYAQTLPELIICSTFNELRNNNLNRTPNFINMTKAMTVQGEFPEDLIKKWKEYDEKKPGGSENPDPRDYGEDHLHLLMFLNNGGTDLESCKFKSGQEALSVLLQVTFSLAAAELEYQFEHRDLHIGNVLVMASKEKEHTYLVDGAAYNVPTNGVTASIIDFSLSRLSKDGFVIHQDLSTDDELFKGTGDYQFDIYRKMKQETGNKWDRFCPKTNIFWLHYLIGKMLVKKFTSKSKAHEAALKTLKQLEKVILKYDSCHNLVLSPVIDDILKK